VRVRVVCVAVLVVLAACGGDSSSDDITVFAAASLTDAFEEVATAFEDANPGTEVTLSFGPSSGLREQILAGAPADVFASASASTMEPVASDAVAFVTNELQLATPAGNEAGITGLADLARDDLLIGLCAEEVPCGRFGREALAKAGVTAAVDTNEADVRSLLTKIEAGELDAGLVYVTDVLAAGSSVEGVDIPDEHNVVATYPIASLSDAGDDFVAFVLSDEGQAILQSYGFGPPA
jgi:molybdate transport system substrate-binding protein